jgi:uncharacterized membrane protein YedE/YeeE
VRPNFTWLSYLLGGFLFGVGMTLGSGCGSKTLVRLGGGSLKSLVVFIFLGIAAYMTLKGLFAIWRTRWIDPVAADLRRIASRARTCRRSSPRARARASRASRWSSPLWRARSSPSCSRTASSARASTTAGGTVVGLVIVGGWYVTGHLGYAENPETLENTFFGTNSRTIESLSFTAPVGFTPRAADAVERQVARGDLRHRGRPSASSWVARLRARIATFRWEGFAGAEDTANHVIGGILMGFGGVTALGCTIGQGSPAFRRSRSARSSRSSRSSRVRAHDEVQYWRMTREYAAAEF